MVVLLFLVLGFKGYGQENDLVISGSFKDLPFQEFVAVVERQTGASFFYFDQWARGIRVTAEGTALSLHEVLDRSLLPAGIYHYIDGFGNVYLTRDHPLIPLIENPGFSESEGGLEVDDIESGRVSRAEQRYIQGHETGMLKTLVIGNDQEAGGQKEVFVHGKIVDNDTGEPLIGATVYLEDLKKGAVTDVDGRFSLRISPGKHRVTFNCMGMEARQNILHVKSTGSLVVRMEKGLIPISEVVVSATKYDNVRGSQMGFERLNYKAIKEVPVVLGEKDLIKVALMLPGVQNVGEGSTGFNVRGGSADQNMISVNRVPVYNGTHLFGFFTSFSPDVVKDFTLYKSNLPASYGGRLSSVFEISTRQGNMNSYSARGGISPITGHVAVEGPVIKDKSAFVLCARSTYSDWILKRLEDTELSNSKASFYDMAGTLTFEPNDNNLIKAFGYYSKDAFALGSTNDYAYSNAGGSFNLNHRYNSRMTGNFALVFGQYGFHTVNREMESAAYSHDYRIDHYEIKSDHSWLSMGKHRIDFGANGIFYHLDRGLVEPYGDSSFRYPVDLGIERGLEVSAYLSDEMSLNERLTVYLGFRFSSFTNGGETSLGPEPRISMTFLTGQHNSVKASYNRVRQYIFMLSNTIAISPTDQWKLCDSYIDPPLVDQFSLGFYQNMPQTGLNASAEVYYKHLANVVDYKDRASFITSSHTETQVVQGTQDAYGLELMLRKKSGKLSGWLSYCYSRSWMLFDSPVPGESINDGLKYPSNYDRPHNLNLVANFRLSRRLSFSSTLEYITGRPVTYPISIYYMNNAEYIEYSYRNEYRIPDYFRMDLSINLEGNLKRQKLAHSFWMLSVYNLTGRDNAYSIYFRSEEGQVNGYKLSIFSRPILTLSWNFKFGNYASE